MFELSSGQDVAKTSLALSQSPSPVRRNNTIGGSSIRRPAEINKTKTHISHIHRKLETKPDVLQLRNALMESLNRSPLKTSLNTHTVNRTTNSSDNSNFNDKTDPSDNIKTVRDRSPSKEEPAIKRRTISVDDKLPSRTPSRTVTLQSKNSIPELKVRKTAKSTSQKKTAGDSPGIINELSIVEVGLPDQIDVPNDVDNLHGYYRTEIAKLKAKLEGKQIEITSLEASLKDANAMIASNERIQQERDRRVLHLIHQEYNQKYTTKIGKLKEDIKKKLKIEMAKDTVQELDSLRRQLEAKTKECDEQNSKFEQEITYLNQLVESQSREMAEFVKQFDMFMQTKQIDDNHQ
jgi:hypothetical protein